MKKFISFVLVSSFLVVFGFLLGYYFLSSKINFRVEDGYIQCKTVASNWKNVISVSDILIDLGENNSKETNSEDEYCTITFDANGGILPINYSDQVQVKKGTCINDLPFPYYQNSMLEFAGWYTTSNGDITVNDGKVTKVTIVNNNLNLKAKWQVK